MNQQKVWLGEQVTQQAKDANELRREPWNAYPVSMFLEARDSSFARPFMGGTMY